MKAYCFKCKAFQEMDFPVRVIMKNGRVGTRGACPVSGTKMFCISKGSAVEDKRT